MTRTIALIMAAAVAFGSGAAAASSVKHADQAKVDSLSPDARQQVMSRMGPEQRVDELMETSRLNQAVAGGFAGTKDEKKLENVTKDTPWRRGTGARSDEMPRPPGMNGPSGNR